MLRHIAHVFLVIMVVLAGGIEPFVHIHPHGHGHGQVPVQP